MPGQSMRVHHLQILEELSAILHHLHKPPIVVAIFSVNLDVLGHVLDALGQDCNLHFRRARVAWMTLKLGYRLPNIMLVLLHLESS